MATKSKFNAVATALLEPFSDDQISERLNDPNKPEGPYNPKFSYVDPVHYRRRLLEIFTNGFEFGAIPESVKEGENGVRAVFYFKGSIPEEGVEYVVTGAPAFADWTKAAKFFWNNETKKRDIPNPDAGKLLNIDQTYSKLLSAGYKAVCRELGVGLHLYDKAARKVGSSPAPAAQPATGSTSPAPAAAATPPGDWDGSKLISFGKKFPGRAYNDPEVDDDYLKYVVDKMSGQHQADAKAELARRAGNAAGSGQAKAAEALNNGASDNSDGEDFPYF